MHPDGEVGHNLARNLRHTWELAQLLERLEQNGQGELLQVTGRRFIDEGNFRR